MRCAIVNDIHQLQVYDVYPLRKELFASDDVYPLWKELFSFDELYAFCKKELFDLDELYPL